MDKQEIDRENEDITREVEEMFGGLNDKYRKEINMDYCNPYPNDNGNKGVSIITDCSCTDMKRAFKHVNAGDACILFLKAIGKMQDAHKYVKVVNFKGEIVNQCPRSMRYRYHRIRAQMKELADAGMI